MDAPPSPPQDHITVYTYHNLPGKYWKKYQYAAKFVQLVRSKTPKVTLYTKEAKCMLMENFPGADFEACFYEGRFIQQRSKGPISYTFALLAERFQTRNLCYYTILHRLELLSYTKLNIYPCLQERFAGFCA